MPNVITVLPCSAKFPVYSCFTMTVYLNQIIEQQQNAIIFYEKTIFLGTLE